MGGGGGGDFEKNFLEVPGSRFVDMDEIHFHPYKRYKLTNK